MSVAVSVVTLNILNLADRWDERLPLLLAETAALQPDLMGLQECVYVLQQDRILGAAGPADYRAVRGWAGRPEYGNSLLVKAPLVPDGPGERLDLGAGRAAHRVVVPLPGGETVLVAVTHLHHLVPDAALRAGQATALLEWLAAAPATTAQVLMGDFNAAPAEPAYGLVTGAGFRSAYREANGVEPAVTWPSGLQAPAMDTDGDPACLDYVFVRGAVRVEGARLCFDRPAAEDPTLFPSDHRGILARLEIG